MTTPHTTIADSKADGILNPAYLPDFALYGEPGEAGIGWELSPEPFWLSPDQVTQIHRLGGVLHRFLGALDLLYRQSEKGLQPAWVAGWLNRGKPEGLLQFARMKRFKSQLPLVIRPDLLMTEDGFRLTEVDAVPGGIGFTAALNAAYRQSGFSVVEGDTSMPEAFLSMLKAEASEVDCPVIAVIVSDEAADYRPEMTCLVETIRAFYPDIYLIHPMDVDLVRDRLVFTDDAGMEKPIDVIYRFFELFDLPNIPKIELIQYAIKKKLVTCTPPFKPHLEEKIMLALIHHPALAGYWRDRLGEDDVAFLRNIVPPTWVVDPAPVPPHAVIPGLTVHDQAVQSFTDLFKLTQKERQLVLKPSGFSPLAWGSRGVTIGHDHPQAEWEARLQSALAGFEATPYILQTFENTRLVPTRRLDPETGEISTFQARLRLCPYYFVQDGSPQLAGILATACPKDKKIIHGMKDAVLAPCMVSE